MFSRINFNTYKYLESANNSARSTSNDRRKHKRHKKDFKIKILNSRYQIRRKTKYDIMKEDLEKLK